MTDELLNRRVLREITKAGNPVSCHEIMAALYGRSDDRLNEVRGALKVLVKDGDVVAVGRFMPGRTAGMGLGRGIQQHEH